ncbi:MAG: tetratricopeptide repeat protein [Phycisphaerae bacterium]|nr:tetratricopeptide repeat protein [Phycisphaerae bacterium]
MANQIGVPGSGGLMRIGSSSELPLKAGRARPVPADRLARLVRRGKALFCRCILLAACTVPWMPPAHAQNVATTTQAAPPSAALASLSGIAEVRPGMSSSELIELARRLAQSRRWQDAEKILTEVIRQEPRNLAAYQLAAQVYEIQASAVRADASIPDAAEKSNTLIDQAVKTYTEYAGPLALEMGDIATAEEIYRTVLRDERHRYNPRALLGIARVMRAKGSMEAIDRYKTYVNPRVCEDGAKDAQAHLELGRLYYERRYFNQAVSTLEKARSLDPENAEILLELARAYQDTAFRPKALAVAEDAVRKDPGNPAYRSFYAQMLLAQSGAQQTGSSMSAENRRLFDAARTEIDGAVRLARAGVQNAPVDMMRLRVLLGCFQVQQQILSVAAGIDPGDVRVVVELARCRQEITAVQHTMQLHGVLSDLKRAPPAARADRAYLELLADLQFRVHLVQEAEETCKELLKLDPDNGLAKAILEQVASAGATSQPGPGTAPSK